MGAGSRPAQTALPPARFHCLLDELPLHLIPQQDRRRSGFPHDSIEPLFLNPHCDLLPAGQIPVELKQRPDLLGNFYLQEEALTVAWVRDPITRALLPFWLGKRLEKIVGHLQPGEPVPESAPADTKLLLAACRILISDAAEKRRAAIWSEILNERGRYFRNKDYAPVSNLIHPFHVAALRRYYRHQIRRGAITLGDNQSSRRYVAHNDSVARFFHQQITSAVRTIVGEPIKPSYVYLASYLAGAELKKHIDRAQCEFSVTLCLDFSPEPGLATPWPIRLDTSQGSVTVYQGVGDGLVYRGTQVPHSRNVLARGYTSTSIFFHYVPADFGGSLE